MLAPNTLLQNRYLIVRSIGHGGMGAVYLARDERLANTVALKETFFTDERLRKAFEREARLLAHLRHPALPKVTDHFDEDGGQFIVMEFISGDDLEMLLAQRGRPFPIEQVLHWADALLKALEYLHKQDPPILHRDIKPANLKLTAENEIILLDFGLAKGAAGQSASMMTSKSIFGFTPNFAPLEQIQGTGTGPRSDLYSLAATLYYLMTGAIPPDALTRITEVANGQPDPLKRADDINPQIPQAVADILMKAMAHNRDQRPGNASEMRRMLREVSPPIPSVIAFEEQTGSDRSANNTLMPSTLVEESPIQPTPVAARTVPSVSPVALTAEQSPAGPETTPGDAPVPETTRAPGGFRLQWAVAGLVVLLLVGVTVGLVSSMRSGKAEGDKAASTGAKDAGLVSSPADAGSQQAIVAPDDSEISTVIDANGFEIKTRKFRSHRLISSVVLTTRDGKQTGKVYSIAGEERELPATKIATALEASGDSLADLVGFVDSETVKGTQTAKAEPRRTSSSARNTAKTKPGSTSSTTSPQPVNTRDSSQQIDQGNQQTKEDPKIQNVVDTKKGSQPRSIKNN